MDSNCFGALFGGLCSNLPDCMAQAQVASMTVSREKADRGALRALVWSEKVTRMLNSILRRYSEEGDRMLASTGVYVCTVCGFVSVGDAPPEQCPVCRVPGWKFEKMEGSVRHG